MHWLEGLVQMLETEQFYNFRLFFYYFFDVIFLFLYSSGLLATFLKRNVLTTPDLEERGRRCVIRMAGVRVGINLNLI